MTSKDGLKVIITGASSGLGKALAMNYAKKGAVIGLISRRKLELEKLAATLPTRSIVLPADVSDEQSLRTVAGDFVRMFGAPDIVIANAGISGGTSCVDPTDNFVGEKIFRTNVIGMIYTFQVFINSMIDADKGSLVGIASVAGFRGMPGSGAYCASKAAAITYLESLRLELGKTNLNVTTICPGYIQTPMTQVNNFRMPFLMGADKAAKLIENAVSNKCRMTIIPWQMRWVSWLLKFMPISIFDSIFKNAPRKPRVHQV